MDETDIPFIKIGQVAKITMDAVPDKTFPGKVTEIGNSPIQAAAGQQRGRPPTSRWSSRSTGDSRSAARVHLFGGHHDGHAHAGGRGADSGDGGARTDVRRERHNRRAPGRPKTPAPDRAGESRLPSCKPGQTRKETEGVFLVRDGKVEFAPIKTGIAGDKYFEVVEGLKEGDQVVTGPVQLRSRAARRDTVKIDNAGRQPRRRAAGGAKTPRHEARPPNDASDSRSLGSPWGRSGPTSCDRS